MPKVTTKDGKTKVFPYTKKGMSQAKAFAQAKGGKESMQGAMKRKVGAGY